MSKRTSTTRSQSTSATQGATQGFTRSIAILGGGNLGKAIAEGLLQSKLLPAERITLTRRNTYHLSALAEKGINVSSENALAVKQSDVIILAVQPQQLDELIAEIASVIDAKRHTIISVASGATITQLQELIAKNSREKKGVAKSVSLAKKGVASAKNRPSARVAVVRAMPNTAIAIRESMTCISGERGNSSETMREAISITEQIFNTVGESVIIDESQMTSATALCACGIAFFLRAIRAASQGGIEIGFHADEAIRMAAQTARGAASLLLAGAHPEGEIDKVTTPRGCTIFGLNEMEHQGFSSAMIRGIVSAADKAALLYAKD